MMLFSKIPMTRVRLFIARILYHLLRGILRGDHRLIRRQGITYEIDLSEGIDLSLFIFGNFQNYVTHNRYVNLKDEAIVFDIGSNIGSMTLPFAKVASRGHVYAFEPTEYAYHKLIKNISLNPKLAERITPVQLFLSDQTKSEHQIKAYSSWRVNGSALNTHPVHGGSIKSAVSVPSVTLDDYCEENKIETIHLIKIDTDGHELNVLKGALRTLKKCLPYVIFEIGLYVMKEQEIEFDDYYTYLNKIGYSLLNAKNGKVITRQNFSSQIPLLSTTDVIAMPPKPPG